MGHQEISEVIVNQLLSRTYGGTYYGKSNVILYLLLWPVQCSIKLKIVILDLRMVSWIYGYDSL